jgi:hypothetical protein
VVFKNPSSPNRIPFCPAFSPENLNYSRINRFSLSVLETNNSFSGRGLGECRVFSTSCQAGKELMGRREKRLLEEDERKNWLNLNFGGQDFLKFFWKFQKIYGFWNLKNSYFARNSSDF